LKWSLRRRLLAHSVARPGCESSLAMARALADAHGASVAVADSALGGLRVELHFLTKH
jgi:hypothetical protein